MEPNYYKDLEPAEFIFILESNDYHYKEPTKQVPQRSHALAQKALLEDGLEPPVTISIPPIDLRNNNLRVHFHAMQAMHSHHYSPDFNYPLIHKILKPVYWNRGPNFATGEGSKPEITQNIDLLGCEFNKAFWVSKIASKGTFLMRNFTFVNKNERGDDLTDKTILAFRDSTFREIQLTDDNNITLGLDELNFEHVCVDTIIVTGLRLKELSVRGYKTHIKELIIRECEIDKLNLADGKIDTLTIDHLDVPLKFRIACEIKSISFFGNSFLPSTYLIGKKDYTINKLEIRLPDFKEKSDYLIKNAYIKSIDMYFVNTNNFTIIDSEIYEMNFEDFLNTGILRLQNLTKTNSLSICNSSMGKTEFINLNLVNTKSVEIYDSNLSESVLVNTTFPKNIKGKSANDYNQIRETYRQLKYASGKQGDRIKELAYEALEMNAFQLDNSYRKTWDEKLILWVNKNTNNHGQSWLKAFTIWFILSIIFFIVIKLAFGYTIVSGLNANDSSQYLEFAFNPLHDFNKVFAKDLSSAESDLGWARLTDTISKIVGGLFLFQLVRAFRKYVK